ncbi:hypothetical protein BJI47_02635 [Rhodococcus sp. 1168]|nr:hypothetical protein BJI47_02635 [Rhodococcus sp. 1168]
MRGQGLLLGADRGLLDRLSDEVRTGRLSDPQRDPAGTICDSDRGSQFRSKKVQRLFKNNGLKGSMGRVGSCLLTG